MSDSFTVRILYFTSTYPSLGLILQVLVGKLGNLEKHP